MKLHVLSENLQKKLAFVNHAVSSRSQLPVLLNFLLEAKDEKLQISATDLEIGIQIEVPANVEEEGGITIPAKIFFELFSYLPQEKITVQTKGDSLEVISKKTKSKFQTLPKEEFPKLYEEKGEEIMIIDKSASQKEFTKVVFAASLDMGRPALSGVLIKKEEGGFSLVATDGYRLSLEHNVIKIKEKGQGEILEKPIIIPARVIKESSFMREEEGDIRVFISKKSNQVLFCQKETILIGRLIEAEFPNYERIIPASFETRVFFDRQEMQKAVKTCAIFARETANIIRLSVRKEAVIISANMPSVGENSVEVEAKTEGEKNEIAFNARYLHEFLSNLEEDEIVFEMTGPLNPGVFKIANNSSFLHLIMPIRVQG